MSKLEGKELIEAACEYASDKYGTRILTKAIASADNNYYETYKGLNPLACVCLFLNKTKKILSKGQSILYSYKEINFRSVRQTEHYLYFKDKSIRKPLPYFRPISDPVISIRTDINSVIKAINMPKWWVVGFFNGFATKNKILVSCRNMIPANQRDKHDEGFRAGGLFKKELSGKKYKKTYIDKRIQEIINKGFLMKDIRESFNRCTVKAVMDE